MNAKIGTIVAAIAALAVIAYVAPMLDIGTPFNAENATAQQSIPAAPPVNAFVDWIKVILLVGIAGAVAVKVKSLFGRR